MENFFAKHSTVQPYHTVVRQLPMQIGKLAPDYQAFPAASPPPPQLQFEIDYFNTEFLNERKFLAFSCAVE